MNTVSIPSRSCTVKSNLPDVDGTINVNKQEKPAQARKQAMDFLLPDLMWGNKSQIKHSNTKQRTKTKK